MYTSSHQYITSTLNILPIFNSACIYILPAFIFYLYLYSARIYILPTASAQTP